MNIIQALEKMGQESSIKQHPSINEMLAANNQDETLLSKVLNQGEELACLVLQDDDDE